MQPQHQDHLFDDLQQDSILEESRATTTDGDPEGRKRDQATTPLSHTYTEQSKFGLIRQLETVVLNLNRTSMECLQREQNDERAL